jgi:hypothetical protein
MTLGVSGTGPYGRISNLRRQIADCKYELKYCVAHQNTPKAKRLKMLIEKKRTEIRIILDLQKKVNH